MPRTRPDIAAVRAALWARSDKQAVLSESDPLKRLEMAQAQTLGLILNRTSARTGDSYSYDSYSSTYAPHPTRRSRRRWLAGATEG